MKKTQRKLIPSQTVQNRPVIRQSPLFELMVLVAEDVCKKLESASACKGKLNSDSAQES
ncbi:hypothetical protein [Gimesia benthica]|uniref:hypothetical protein n=1 Tax=Gimesia benthica TaxID=2608982 RepID=UPI0012D35E42|nr:hypothetical protein [Gimesia benthica]